VTGCSIDGDPCGAPYLPTALAYRMYGTALGYESPYHCNQTILVGGAVPCLEAQLVEIYPEACQSPISDMRIVSAERCDGDFDGVSDAEDACPGAAGSSSTEGCPDRDGDRFADWRDSCPEAPAPSSSNGCPPQPDLQFEGLLWDLRYQDVQRDVYDLEVLASPKSPGDGISSITVSIDGQQRIVQAAGLRCERLQLRA
jgi:hypothetical protein